MTQGNGTQPVTIAATATAVPPHRIGRDEVKRYMQHVFSLDDARLEAMLAIVDNSQVKQRYCIDPIETIIEPRTLDQVNRTYSDHAIRLGTTVAKDCLARAGMSATDVDLFITVSCTGVMIPSLDAHLANLLGFRSDVRRLPITELGCAAGAAALGYAADHLRAYPHATALIVAVELPSLTFQRHDRSQANLISSILFGDGAAAAIVTGNDTARGPRIARTESFLFPDSLGAMGFDLQANGFHIILSRDVPELIRKEVRALVDAFLGRAGVRREDLSAFIVHPGGQKLLTFIEEERKRFGVTRLCRLAVTRVRHQSSVRAVRSARVVGAAYAAARAHGLLAAFGPGSARTGAAAVGLRLS
jgi:alkylresorcinol/alkylpyrone synthase